MAEQLEKEFKNGKPYLDLPVERRRRDDSIFENRTARAPERGEKKRTCARRTEVGFWFLSFMTLFIGCHGFQEQKFAREPQDQNAIIGSKVILPCRVVNKVGTLQWTKDDFGLGTHRNLSGFSRYTMIGSDEEGDYSLEIRDVALEDDGRYQCQVSSGLNGEPGIRSQYANLTVLVAPDPPRIVQGAFLDTIEEQPIDIECISVGGKPAAEITWVVGNQEVKKNVQNKVELMSDGMRYTTRSVLRLTPGQEHHNQTITCQAQNTADRAYRVATLNVEVKYAPKVQLSVKSGEVNGKIHEGSEARFRCGVEANPPAQVYRWYINGSPVIGDYTDEMIIFNVSRNHSNAIIKCEVSNQVGRSERTVSLLVTYPPSFRSPPKDVEAEEGTTVILTCDVDGQPTPEIRWLYREPGRIGVKGKSATLNVVVSNETAGSYICKASVDGYPEIQSEASIFVKGVPKILSNRTQFGSEGDTVRLECTAFSVPKPDDIRWYYEGKEINIILDPEYALAPDEVLSHGLVRSTLVIRASQSRHYGLYNCSVTNEYGNDNAAILLKPLKSLPLFIILIGVTSGIVAFSGLVVFLVYCHRRRRQIGGQLSEKPDVTVTSTDMYKDSDRSSNISDLKMQLQQSDGTYCMDYTSSDRSDSKPHAALPLAGPVPISIRHDDPLLHFRYSNDYSDPAYSDSFYKNHGTYVYDFPAGYAPPPHLRVQSPTHLEVPNANRSLQGSLTRSIDTTSTLPLSTGNGSQQNSLQRTNKSTDEVDAINNLGLPVGGDTPPAPIYAQPHSKNSGSGVDIRYAATYGNPYLRNSSMSFGGQVHTAKPASTPAPPPYSAVRSSVVIPSGNGNQPSQATHV